MVQKVFNFGGSEADYEVFKNSVGNVSQFLSSVILGRIPKKENAMILIYQMKLEQNSRDIEESYTKIEILKKENEHILEQIKEQKEEHLENQKREAKKFAHNRILQIKSSVDVEYDYMKRMKAEGFKGTLEEYLVQEFFKNLD